MEKPKTNYYMVAKLDSDGNIELRVKECLDKERDSVEIEDGFLYWMDDAKKYEGEGKRLYEVVKKLEKKQCDARI